MKRTSTACSWCVILVCLSIILQGAQARQPRIGVLTAEGSDLPNMEVYMENAFPGGTGFWDASDTEGHLSPTLNWILQWDALLVFSDYQWANQTQTCNNLATYADQGGRVVMGLYATYTAAGDPKCVCDSGPWADTYNVMIPAIAGSSDVYTDDTVDSGNYLPDHPIMQGFTTLTDYEGDRPLNTSQVTAGTYVVAGWADGSMMVAVKDGVGPYGRSRVDLGFYPMMGEDSSTCNWLPTSTDPCLQIPLVTINALKYTLRDFSSPASSLSSFWFSFLSSFF